ncbi:MAG: PspC domain-containing protein [Desulfitobacteriaceae bacterium]|nr:PspC domain-containing protein [Desulfitobacteriaceae bacterium]MDI6878204.1 PspC domain-containing protein [Desulfitobacteriaceae bacterium]MDI6913483.1 PspC domain-containing protein [Desulfitobacteriaceae bacterium]
MTERLYRSGRNKILGGVCGGLAEYFNIDVTLVRLIALVAMFAGGVGFLAYLAGWIIMPMDPNYRTGYQGAHGVYGTHGAGATNTDFSDEIRANVHEMRTDIQDAAHNLRKEVGDGRGSKLAGIVLIILGLMFFLDRWFPLWFSLDKMWPLILIGIGVAVIFRK